MKLVNFKNSILTISTLAMILTAGTVYAAKGGVSSTNQGATPNGKPFTFINAQIQEQADLIGDLQSEIYLIGGEIASINDIISIMEGIIQANTDAIAANLAATNGELQNLRDQLASDIGLLQDEINALQGQITGLQTQIANLTNDLASQLSDLQTAVYANTGNIMPLMTQVATMTAQIMVLNAQVLDPGNRLQLLEEAVVALQLQVAQIDVRLTFVEGVAHSHGMEGLCLSFVNTPAEDVTGNDWFDACVTAAQEGGKTIAVLLKDENGAIVYEANGSIVGDWTQNYITSNASQSYQYRIEEHDQAITLNNGDLLLISGKSGNNSGWMGSHGNGYGIRIHSSPGYAINYRLIAYPYTHGLSNTPRYFTGWSMDKEITWNGGNVFGTAPSGYGQGTGTGFHGTLEIYIN